MSDPSKIPTVNDYSMRFLECEIFGLIIVIVILLIYFFEIIGLTIGALLILFSIAMKLMFGKYGKEEEEAPPTAHGHHGQKFQDLGDAIVHDHEGDVESAHPRRSIDVVTEQTVSPKEGEIPPPSYVECIHCHPGTKVE